MNTVYLFFVESKNIRPLILGILSPFPGFFYITCCINHILNTTTNCYASRKQNVMRLVRRGVQRQATKRLSKDKIVRVTVKKSLWDHKHFVFAQQQQQNLTPLML